MASTAKSVSLPPAAMLGIKTEQLSELIRQVERGFSYHSLASMESQSGISVARIAEIIGIPERTLARRKSSGRLTSDESERLLRISSIFSKSVALFEGDKDAAVKWLTTPRKALSDQSPFEYLRTELGAREVENLIGRLEDGVFS